MARVEQLGIYARFRDMFGCLGTYWVRKGYY